jgi:hypothetical protein
MKFNGKIGTFVCLGFGILFIWLTVHSLIFDAACQATEGMLDCQYLQTTHVFLSSYTVFYTYQVNGISYHESDCISHRPIIQTVPVYYNPSNPEESSLERGQWVLWSIGAAVSIGGIVFSFWRSKNKLAKLTGETKSEHWENYN